MDQMTPFQTFKPFDQPRPKTRPGRAALKIFLVIILVAGALVIGYRAGDSKWPMPSWLTTPLGVLKGGPGNGARVPGPIAYYRHPDGKPSYVAEPTKTDDGRDYLPVHAGEDVSFDEQAKDAGSPSATAEPSKKIHYYRNPMGLPDTSPVPKKDSMGMDYLPVYEGDAEDTSVVKVSPGKLQRTGVRSELVERRVVTRPVRAPGTITLDERRVSVISMRSDAYIDKVENVTTGDRVRKGQPLLRLYSPEIAAASAQYLSVVSEPGATGGSAGRPLVLEGARRRLENLNVPPEVIADIERTRKVPVTITWSAPRDGIVLQRNAVEGMKAPSGEVLFRIADISTVWVLADVPEHDLGAVRVGQSATIRVRSLPGEHVNGKVGLIYPQVNQETRTTRLRIELPNPNGVLLPDMYADVEIATGSEKPVVAVPDSAVIDTGTRQVIIIDKGEGRFEPREVKVGERGNGFVAIREGVAVGDLVVVSANFLIDAESNLKAALQGMAAPAGEEAAPAKEKAE